MNDAMYYHIRELYLEWPDGHIGILADGVWPPPRFEVHVWHWWRGCQHIEHIVGCQARQYGKYYEHFTKLKQVEQKRNTHT